MDLKKIAEEINEILEKRREELSLSFIEEDHIYFMKDLKGKVRTDFPSVSTVLKSFYVPFDAPKKSLSMCNGDPIAAKQLQEVWNGTADYATNMGSRAHYELEKETILRNGNYKEVRKPIFECDEEQMWTSDEMIKGGNSFLDLMEKRGAVLLDTEIVLGDNEYGYTGQPDKVWLMMSKKADYFGFVITDWKGLPLDTPILTQNGWKTMGSLDINDKVFDKDGLLVNIKNFSKIKNVECIKIKFDNGEEIVSDFEHRWLIYTSYHGKNYKVMTTQEIKDYYEDNKTLKPYQILRIENAKPLQLPERELPIDPYLLGVWLGDGHSSCGMITQMNEKVWEEIERRGYKIGNDVSNGGSGKAQTKTIFNIRGELIKMDLLNNKHLPEDFILSSYNQRLDLLRGLMDADGHYNKLRKRFSVSTTRINQVNFCVELISSLGLKTTVIEYNKKLNSKIIKCFNVEFSTDQFNPFLCRNQDIEIKYKKDRRTHRRIVSVESVESTPTRCIEVNSESNTFLFGKSLIVTHNTNKPKNFEVQSYTEQMLPPFTVYPDTALTHYYIQLPLYGKLLIKMLKGSKYENIKMMGGVVVLLKKEGNFLEYKIPPPIVKTVLDFNIKNYI